MSRYQKQYLEYIKSHPGCTVRQVSNSFSEDPRFASPVAQFFRRDRVYRTILRLVRRGLVSTGEGRTWSLTAV